MTNEEIIQLIMKTITTSAGGNMNQQQLDEFILEGVKSSDFLSEIRIETGIQKSLKLDRLGVNPRMLRPGVEATAPTAGDNISPAYRELTPKEVIAYESLSYSFLRQALGGAADFNPDVKTKVEEQIQALLQAQYLADIVDLFFNGDTGSGTAFLTCLDGLLVKAAADSEVHTDNYSANSKLYDVFTAMLNALPEQYQQDPANLRFYVSKKTKRRYKTEESLRETLKGDSLRFASMPVFCEDVLVKDVFAVPDGKIILTLPKNLSVGWGTEMLVERDKDIKKRVVDLVMTSTVDVNHVIGDALVLFTEV